MKDTDPPRGSPYYAPRSESAYVATFDEQHHALSLYDEAALEGFLEYHAHTAPGPLAVKRYDEIKKARVRAIETLRKLAIMQEVHGYERVEKWLGDAYLSAVAAKRVRQGGAAS